VMNSVALWSHRSGPRARSRACEAFAALRRVHACNGASAGLSRGHLASCFAHEELIFKRRSRYLARSYCSLERLTGHHSWVLRSFAGVAFMDVLGLLSIQALLSRARVELKIHAHARM